MILLLQKEAFIVTAISKKAALLVMFIILFAALFFWRSHSVSKNAEETPPIAAAVFDNLRQNYREEKWYPLITGIETSDSERVRIKTSLAADEKGKGTANLICKTILEQFKGHIRSVVVEDAAGGVIEACPR